MKYDTNTFEMTFYLSNFIGARTVVEEDENGEPEVGVFIPAARNGLAHSREDNEKWLTWGFVQELDMPMGGFTHRVMHKTNPAHLREIKSQGFDVPLLARMKPTRFYHRKKTNVDTRVDSDGIDL